jgi:parallel beta-helix repeat protein
MIAMGKKTVMATTITIALLISLVAGLQFVEVIRAEPRTIIVPTDYSTIQAALDSASEGDEVFVKNGTYNENLTVNKSLSIVGENAGSTIVVGEGTTALLVQHDNVNVSGFTFKRPSTMRWYYGVHLLSAHDCNVFGNQIESTFYGIWLFDSAFNNIYENTLMGNWNGIYLSASDNNNVSNNDVTGSHDWGISTDGSDNNIIMNNYVASSGWGGIGLDGGGPNRNNLIAVNVVTHSGDIGIGITSSDSTENKIVSNDITATGSEDGGDFAIRIAWDSNLVLGNRLTGNQAGIYLEGARNNNITRNLIENNAEVAFRVHSYPYKNATNNFVWENNIVNNSVVAISSYIASLTFWDADSRGNYWSNYNGLDVNSDGVGEIPYVIDGVNIDHYPLMAPVNTTTDITAFLPSPTPLPSPSPSPSPTPSPYDYSTPIPYSYSPTPSSSPAPTYYPPPITPTPTPTPTPTANPTFTPTPTPTVSPTPSPSLSPTPTEQPTLEPTQSASPTIVPIVDGIDPLPYAIGIVAAVVVAVTIVGLAVYSKKYRK